jgi:homoprotocatechuate degradation regulator HpaR
MSQSHNYRNLPQLILKAREKLLSHFRPIISNFGLTEQQWRILRTLDEMKQLEPRQICQILSPSLAGVLSRMESSGLVTRTRFETDQRRVTVCLTPKGERVVAELRPLIMDQYKEIEDHFGPALIAELYDVLDRLLLVDDEDIPQIPLPRKRKLAK